MTDRKNPSEFDLMKAAINSELEQQMVSFGFDKEKHNAAFKHFINNASASVLLFGTSDGEINDRIQLLKSKKQELPKADISLITREMGAAIGEAYIEGYVNTEELNKSRESIPGLLESEKILTDTLNMIAYRAGIDFLIAQQEYSRKANER